MIAGIGRPVALGQGSIVVKGFPKALSEARRITAVKTDTPDNFMIGVQVPLEQ